MGIADTTNQSQRPRVVIVVVTKAAPKSKAATNTRDPRSPIKLTKSICLAQKAGPEADPHGNEKKQRRTLKRADPTTNTLVEAEAGKNRKMSIFSTNSFLFNWFNPLNQRSADSVDSEHSRSSASRHKKKKTHHSSSHRKEERTSKDRDRRDRDRTSSHNRHHHKSSKSSRSRHSRERDAPADGESRYVPIYS